MIKIGALVVEVTGVGGVSECPNHVLQGALPQDIATAKGVGAGLIIRQLREQLQSRTVAVERLAQSRTQRRPQIGRIHREEQSGEGLGLHEASAAIRWQRCPVELHE